jgi:hypothetical protein
LAWHNKTDETAADQIRASRSRQSAAVQSTFAGTGGLNADAQIIPAPVPVTPTVYPDQPDGTVIVQNHITINIQSVEFRDFNANVGKILDALPSLNTLSPEVRDQLRAEISAGKALLTAPKPHPTLIELLLKRPLLYIAEKAGGALISKVAVAALELLGKITGLW